MSTKRVGIYAIEIFCLFLIAAILRPVIGLPSMFLAALAYAGHYAYKFFVRRCSCGEVFEVRRVYKIRLSDHVPISLKEVWRGRWLIRRVRRSVFRVCDRCKMHDRPHTHLVRVSTEPITMLELWWIKRKDPEQLYTDPNLDFIANQTLKEWRKSDAKDPEVDNPPLPTLGYHPSVPPFRH